MDNLVQIYKSTLSDDFCNHVINLFENDNNQIEGMAGGGVNKNIKDSTDLMIHNYLDNPEWDYVYDYSSQSSLIRTAQLAFKASNNSNPHMQIQRYTGDQGFHSWHHENHGGTMGKRELAFLYYLNDVDEGETEMKYNPQKISPETGKLALFPAYWTHKHRGNSPKDGQTKYVITGWIEGMGKEEISNEFSGDYFM